MCDNSNWLKTAILVIFATTLLGLSILLVVTYWESPSRSVFSENILKVNTMFDWKTYGYKLDVAGSQSYEQEIIFVLGLHFTHEISLLELFLMKKVDLYSYSNEKFMVLL